MCYSQTVSPLHGNVWIQSSGNTKCFPRLFTVSLSFQLPWVGRKYLTSTLFLFPEWFFSCACVSCEAKKKNSISFEWCKSGALLVSFVVFANKLTWQFTAPDADRWYSHWTQVLKNKLSSLSLSIKQPIYFHPAIPGPGPKCCVQLMNTLQHQWYQQTLEREIPVTGLTETGRKACRICPVGNWMERRTQNSAQSV